MILNFKKYVLNEQRYGEKVEDILRFLDLNSNNTLYKRILMTLNSDSINNIHEYISSWNKWYKTYIKLIMYMCVDQNYAYYLYDNFPEDGRLKKSMHNFLN